MLQLVRTSHFIEEFLGLEARAVEAAQICPDAFQIPRIAINVVGIHHIFGHEIKESLHHGIDIFAL